MSYQKLDRNLHPVGTRFLYRILPSATIHEAVVRKWSNKFVALSASMTLTPVWHDPTSFVVEEVLPKETEQQ